jgi:plastocyanin
MKRISQSGGKIARGLAVLAALVLLVGCRPGTGKTPVGTGTPSAAVTPTAEVISGQVTIFIQEGEFHPQKITVKAGTKISWLNKDPDFLIVRSDDGLFESSSLAIGQMFSFTFDKPGTYPYYCTPGGGPGGEGMSGVITVVE